MKKLFMIFMAAFLFVGIVACGGKTTEAPTTGAPTTVAPTTDGPTTQAPTTVAPTTLESNELPVIAGVGNVEVIIGDAFDPLAGVTATDEEDGNLTNITYTGTLDLFTAGAYTLTYSVTDSDGGVGTATRVITVVDVDLVMPTGFFNYKFATTELRHTFMAAAERYLLENMYGGIPLFANSGFALYSSRLQFPVNEYLPVMGFGTSFGSFSADDSTVKMEDGSFGVAGEYTYRTASTTNPVTWNHWQYDTSTDSDYMGLYQDSLYAFEFNEDKTGYAVNPSMASDNPQPIESDITDTGKEVAYTWRVPLRTDLEWFYHPDTDISGLPAGHEIIDANDFILTFKLALEKGWFRAISGGGDFIAKTNKIVNAEEFKDGDATWEEVGLKVYDDFTLEFTFVEQQSEWNVKYWLSSFVMTPINLELYAALQDGENNSYGTSNKTIAYHGPYYVDYFEADKVLKYKANPSYYDTDKFFYTGYSFAILADAAVMFDEFEAGKLEGVTLPAAKYEDYKNHPGLKRIPGATVFRLMINGLGTVQNQQDQFPASTFVPEPILANHDFKMALYFAIDRQTLAWEVMKTSDPAMFLFTDAYLVDAELGIPYRATPQGESVGEGLSVSTYGFNEDAAVAYWELAIDALVADGTYQPGTAASYNTITIDIVTQAASASQVLLYDYLKAQFEELFVSNEHYIKVVITNTQAAFPDNYYKFTMVGNFDLGTGGISGSTLDAASFLDVFADDNRGGFTLNWGIDTSTSNIEIRYVDFNGVYHREMWSFNAIVSALNGTVYVVDGAEISVPAPKIIDVTPTTMTFTISEFNNPSYTNITYTIYEYQQDGTGYVLFGEENVVPTSSEITLTGLKPYPFDYAVEVSYSYAEDETQTGAQDTWEYTAPLIPEEGTVVTENSAIFTLNQDDRARIFTTDSVVLYEISYDENDDPVYTEITTATITIDGSTLTISGLTADTEYAIEYGTDDAFATEVAYYCQYLEFATEAAPVV